jgi:hypothetical protein
MNSGTRNRRIVGRLIIVGAGALLATGGWALASSQTNVIKACYAKHGGMLRLTTSCTKRERAISWSEVGPRGAPGAQGPHGPQGVQGQAGNTGPAGSYPTTLPSGETERGVFAGESDDAGNGAAHTYSPISFPIALASAPTVQVIQGPSSSQCSGTAAAPEAAAGYLCIYVRLASGTVSEFDPSTATSDAASKWGANLSVVSNNAAYLYGSWAVTAS